jgi:hypothetical protein
MSVYTQERRGEEMRKGKKRRIKDGGGEMH